MNRHHWVRNSNTYWQQKGRSFQYWRFISFIFLASAAPYLSAHSINEESATKTPIKHLIVLVEENKSFDKIFGTYPYAANPDDEKSPRFYGKVGNKAPNNYLLTNEQGLPVDKLGEPITQFTGKERPLFNPILTDNPNEITPFRQSFNTYTCYSSHQYNDELWAYGIWIPYLNLLGEQKLDHFVKFGGLGYGGSIALNHLEYTKELVTKNNYPFWRQRFGYGCYGPPNHLRNLYNAAGEPGSTLTILPEEELMTNTRKYFTVKGAFNMGYWDGNTTQALWQYAQHFTLADNFHQLTFGPSTLGHLSLIFGTTGPFDPNYTKSSVLEGEDLIDFVTRDSEGRYFMVSDLNPVFDICDNSDLDSKAGTKVAMAPKNIGNVLTDNNISWGWFSGGFRLSGGKKACLTPGITQYGVSEPIYAPGIEPFQYSKSTANPKHLAPSKNEIIGNNGLANHQYDLADFIKVLDADRLPAVNYLKPKTYQNSHGDISSPLDEQNWLVNIINKIQLSNSYKRGEVAIFIVEDDSDGDYDHVLVKPEKNYSGNTLFGPGPRTTFLSISPYSKKNYVDSTLMDQASIIKFIKYNWNLGNEPINAYSTENHSGSLLGLFNFSRENMDAKPLLLYCDGSIYDGSTNTPPPQFYTTSGPVSEGQNNLKDYQNLRLKNGQKFSNGANLPIRKEGLRNSTGDYECANQFGY